MTDIVSQPRRSEIMSRIGSRNTAPEIIVRSVAHRLGFRFRLHVANLPGKPDIVLPRHKAVIEVRGCYWHRHAGCPNCSTPKTHPEFWQEKFKATVRRDQRNERLLRKSGWRVLIIWECESTSEQTVERRLLRFFREPVPAVPWKSKKK